MLVRSEHQAGTGDTAHMALNLPTRINSKDAIPISLNICWTKPDSDPDFNLIGCKIVNIQPKDFQILLQLILEIASSNPISD